MVARRSGNDSTLVLVARQLCQRIARAPFLEASRALQVVELAENLHAGDLAQRNGGRTRRIINSVRSAFARGCDVLKCDQAFNSRVLPAPQPIGQSESGMDCNLHNQVSN